MGRRLYAAKTDNSQKSIVEALREVGAKVWVIKEPCDLLTRFRGRWLPLECKTGTRKRNDQPEQDAFLAENDVPVVRTPEDALKAIGAI